MNTQPNKLIDEVSPYLLQHAYNPVNWYSWGEEALEIARKENKLLLISIGYSSCHWCHVMERESFTDSGIAEIMNSNYVCIKVDREERPDIDQVYMNAVQIITRRGGWPLNCFALPDGRPVYGGTYFPKEQWLGVLESLQETWAKEPWRVIEVAEDLEQGISNSEKIQYRAAVDGQNYKEILRQNIHAIKNDIDFKQGGTKGAPKFPMPGLLKFLLEYSVYSPDEELRSFVFTSLEKITNGGIYDHVGGGFFRYSVDEKWHVPHFEKMLYDNAQLIELYSLAYRVNPNPLYKRVVDETVRFLTRELQASSGGFYSALDADSNGSEGEFYTWSKDETELILGFDTELFCSAYGIAQTGNWNNTNVLKRCATSNQLESIFNIPWQEIDYRINQSLQKLARARGRRVPPQIDDKIITSWNGLAVAGLVQAYISFGNPHYLELALGAVGYIESNHFTDGALQRISCKGKVYAEPLLDDYANYIRSILLLYNATLDPIWLIEAGELMDKVIGKFYDHQSGMFFYTPSNTKLIARKMELIDGVIPSANATMAANLFAVSGLTKNESYRTLAVQMLANIAENTGNSGMFIYAWAEQFLLQLLPNASILLHNDDSSNLIEIQRNTVYPKILMGKAENSTQKGIQLCLGKACLKPTVDIESVITEISQIRVE